MTGVRPIANEIARTRSLRTKLSIEKKRNKRYICSLYISVRWAHHVGRDTQDVFDDFLRPPKLSNDLFVGQGRQGEVTPCMNGNLMLTHVLALKHGPVIEDARSNDEESGFELFLVEEFEQIGRIECWAVIISQTPCHGGGALDNVTRTCAATTSPPASIWIAESDGVIRASTS